MTQPTNPKGNGPPDISPEALVAMLRQRPRPSKEVEYPGRQYDGTPLEKVRIIVQPSSANGQAQLAAHIRMRDEMKLPMGEWQTETGTAILNDLVAKEMIARMVYSTREISPGNYVRIFSDSKTVEQICSADEVAVLFELCRSVQLELGPRLQVLTDSEVDAWVEKLKGGFDPLAYLGSEDLAVLIRGLHRRLVKFTSSEAQDFPDEQWLTSSESSQMTSVTDTSSSGEQQSRPLVGITTSEDISQEEAMQFAKELFRRNNITPTE